LVGHPSTTILTGFTTQIHKVTIHLHNEERASSNKTKPKTAKNERTALTSPMYLRIIPKSSELETVSELQLLMQFKSKAKEVHLKKQRKIGKGDPGNQTL
jgi:ERCC4-type nuclease